MLPPLEADAAAGNRRQPKDSPASATSPRVVDLTLDLPVSPNGDSPAGPQRSGQPLGDEEQRELQHLRKQRHETKLHNVIIRKRCAQLEKLVGMHLQAEGRSQMQTASEDAENLAILAGSLGVEQLSPLAGNVYDQVRVCKCGNLLMDDSKFCRKCGSEYAPSHSNCRRQNIANLSVKLGDVAAQLEDAIGQLAKELQNKQDPSRAHAIAEAERKVTQLKREQKGYETQLLAERTMDSWEEVETMENLETCTCNCFKELEVTRDMLKQLRSLCAEMASKIKQATDDNLQLNSALDSTLVSLQNAKKCIGRSKAMQPPHTDEDLSLGLAALDEAEHSAVFFRLFNPNSETKKKWKDKKSRLIQESMKAMEAVVVFHQEDENPSPTKQRRPSRPVSQSSMLAGDGEDSSPTRGFELAVKGRNKHSLSLERINTPVDSDEEIGFTQQKTWPGCTQQQTLASLDEGSTQKLSSTASSSPERPKLAKAKTLSRVGLSEKNLELSLSEQGTEPFEGGGSSGDESVDSVVAVDDEMTMTSTLSEPAPAPVTMKECILSLPAPDSVPLRTASRDRDAKPMRRTKTDESELQIVGRANEFLEADDNSESLGVATGRSGRRKSFDRSGRPSLSHRKADPEKPSPRSSLRKNDATADAVEQIVRRSKLPAVPLSLSRPTSSRMPGTASARGPGRPIRQDLPLVINSSRGAIMFK